jgi:hypothetical protein
MSPDGLHPCAGCGGAKELESEKTPMGKEQAERTAEQDEKGVFGQELAKNSDAASAEGHANSNFAVACGGATEKQIGEVGAGDQKNETGGGEEGKQHGTDRTDDFFAEADDVGLHAGIGIGIELSEVLRNALQFGLGLLEWDTALEAGYDEEIVAAMVGEILRSEREWHPELVIGIREMKILGRHADDGITFAVEKNGFAKDSGVGSKAALPQAVANHDDVPAGGLIVFRGEDAAKSGIHF